MDLNNNLPNDIDYGDYYKALDVSFYESNLGIITIIFFTIFIFIATLLLCYLFLKFKRSSPEYIAKKELDKLTKEINNNKNTIGYLYFKLTEILKRYIFKRYGVNSLAMTDSELINYFETINCTQEIKYNIKLLIKNAQNAKFAFFQVAKESLEHDVSNTILLINNVSKLSKNIVDHKQI